MNYLGTMSILDRGDAPAQAVIDRNSRALAQRVANETKEELEKVMNRVENICENFEMTNDADFGSNMEFVSDITELAELLQDQVKKKKYQAQVTVFIVGFQEVSSQKLKLLQQVNEFFLDSIRNFEDDLPNTPDVDLVDVTHKIDESLDVARGLAGRLGEINQDIIEYLIHYAENKAKNKGKKKLEKALQAAKDDLSSLSEKLLGVQSDLEEKDEKMQQLYKQLEIKTLENQKYRTAAEVAKKNLLDAERLKDDIVMRDEKIRDMRQVISRLEIDLTQARHGHEQTQNRLDNASMESQQKLLELQKGVDGNKMQSNEAKREMEKIHESQIKKMLKSHTKEIEDLKEQHGEEVEKLMECIQETYPSPSTSSKNTTKNMSSFSLGKRKRIPTYEQEDNEQILTYENGSSKKSNLETVMKKIDKLETTFQEGILTLQKQLRDERKFYMECEERRLKFFAELEEKRRRDEREHELKLFKLFSDVRRNASADNSSQNHSSNDSVLGEITVSRTQED